MRSPEDRPTDPSELIRIATISHVDLADGTCRAMIDEALETGDIAWIESRMGDTRIWSPPTIGEQVILLCEEGEIGAAIALRGVRSDQFPPAGSSLEERIQFKDGAVISYDPEAHALKAILPDGGTVQIGATGGISITGDVTIAGDVAIDGEVTVADDVTADGISLVNHKHKGVTAGGAQSGKPV